MKYQHLPTIHCTNRVEAQIGPTDNQMSTIGPKHNTRNAYIAVFTYKHYHIFPSLFKDDFSTTLVNQRIRKDVEMSNRKKTQNTALLRIEDVL